jgi:predicted O-methyltransferase YrrM
MHEIGAKISHYIPNTIRKRLLKLFQSIMWTIYFRKYIKIINQDKIPDKGIIQNLIFGWGNQSFSAKLDYINSMIKYARINHKLIFECGSGLSTLLLGVIAQKRNIKMVSFEHLPEWADKVKKELHKYKITSNEIYIQPLKNYGNFEWYETSNTNTGEIGLCICDAPPGNTFGGRKGFLYLMKDKVKTGTVILVDDTIRKAEQEMIKEWEKISSIHVAFEGENDNHAIITVL